MELRIHFESRISHFVLNDSFIEKLIDNIIEVAFQEVDKVPMARSSIKAVLGVGMRKAGIKNPDPRNMTDIDFAIALLKGKLGGYLIENGLDAVGEEVD